MTNETRELRSEEWAEYIDGFALRCSGAPTCVALERSSGERNVNGAKREQELRQLHTIDYDAERDVLVVAVGNGRPSRPTLRYFVSAPRAISVAESDHERAILVDDASGVRTIVTCAARDAAAHPARPAQARRATG